MMKADFALVLMAHNIHFINASCRVVAIKTPCRAPIKSYPTKTMARMLADRDSSALHLNQARRHERLARRYRQDGYATSIRSVIDALQNKADNSAAKELERQGATDDVAAADADLDDAIRSLYNSAEISERENPGSGVLMKLFPEGGFTAITSISTIQEPAAADALAIRLEDLGGTHALAPHAQKIRTLATAVRNSFTALETAIRTLKAAEAEEEIAQAALRRQYELNYLEARKQLGRPLAERLFPVTRSSGPAEEPAPTPA
jgi:hypothetical protein